MPCGNVTGWLLPPCPHLLVRFDILCKYWAHINQPTAILKSPPEAKKWNDLHNPYVYLLLIFIYTFYPQVKFLDHVLKEENWTVEGCMQFFSNYSYSTLPCCCGIAKGVSYEQQFLLRSEKLITCLLALNIGVPSIHTILWWGGTLMKDDMKPHTRAFHKVARILESKISFESRARFFLYTC